MSAKRHSLILRLLLLPFLLLRPAEGSSLDLIPVSILCDSDYSITGKRESDQKDVAGVRGYSDRDIIVAAVFQFDEIELSGRCLHIFHIIDLRPRIFGIESAEHCIGQFGAAHSPAPLKYTFFSLPSCRISTSR